VKNARFVYVLEGPTDGWYKVEFDGAVGWESGGYLGAPRRGLEVAPTRRPAPAPAPAPQPAAAPAPAAQPAPAAPAAAPAESSEVGHAIAQKARSLVGSPYAWGGTSPRYGFDCSGLIAYVMGQFDIWAGRTSYDQAGAGYSVTGKELRPGDIVVFANTFGPGYSHTGIYIGGGQFVHAEDWDTGVRVSSLGGGFWGRHYVGARRVT
jgi:cell wall-associated NlpC family hydrolase